MKPCPAEAAAVALEYHAREVEAGTATDITRCDCARALEKVPLVHPLRLTSVQPGYHETGQDEGMREGIKGDAVHEAARAVRKGTMPPDAMRALAVRLREGAPTMRETGWYATFYGPDSMDARGES